uniref:Uncharacterized protein n=1 Tax=Oryza nivara TaxID=4536 RepID=A0A0E0GCL6_ORYNI
MTIQSPASHKKDSAILFALSKMRRSIDLKYLMLIYPFMVFKVKGGLGGYAIYFGMEGVSFNMKTLLYFF